MPTSGSEQLLWEKRDKIVVMTINRPEKLNTITPELWEMLAQAWERFQNDDDAWVAIITGAGDRAFCAGAELKTSPPGAPVKMLTPRLFFMETWKPMIAAINGYAIAGGWLLAQKCDIRIAAEHAELGISETRINAPCSWITDLGRQLHLGHALEIALWGDARITAQRGYEMGWINRVVPKERLMAEAMSWAERILLLGPQSVRTIKETIYRGYYMPPSIGLPFALHLQSKLPDMEDTREGRTAFFEKRKPIFKNR